MQFSLVLLIGLIMFMLGQSVQAFSISALIGILSKRFGSIQQVQSEERLFGGFIVLSTALFFLLVNSLFQVGIWAIAFVLVGQFDQYGDAFYHSAVNFATLGYGDIVMEAPWRLLGALEAISGILMLGLSTATLSTIFSKLMQLRYSNRR